jgi:hypothetical protein
MSTCLACVPLKDCTRSLLHLLLLLQARACGSFVFLKRLHVLSIKAAAAAAAVAADTGLRLVLISGCAPLT